MNRWFFPLLLIFVFGSSLLPVAEASPLSQKLQGLQPISGSILEHSAGQAVIDLDATRGLQVGDLVSVSVPGKKLVDPHSGKLLGRLEETRSLLEVTRIKHGYSLARPLDGSELPKIGAKVLSFSGVATVLIAGEANGELYRQLQLELPALDWQGIFPTLSALPQAEAIPLRFQLVGHHLQLSNRQGRVLRDFPLNAPPVSGSGTASQPVPFTPGPAGLRTEAGLDERVLQGCAIQTPAGTRLATVDGQRIRIYAPAAGSKPLAEFAPDAKGRPLAVSWWQPAAAKQPLLLVTSVVETLKDYGQITETRLVGEIYRWTGTRAELTAGGLAYLLGGFDADGDGTPELLLGQQFDPDRPFGPVFRLTLQGHEVSRGKPDLVLPTNFTVSGSTLADLDGDGTPEIVQVRKGVLTVYRGREVLYRSSRQMGGSLAAFSFARNPDQIDQLISTATLEISPLVADLDADGQPEILAVGADLGSFHLPGVGTSVKQSWVDLLHRGPAGFEKERLTKPRENPVQALWQQDGRLWLVESLTTSDLAGQGHSRLLSMPLPGAH